MLHSIRIIFVSFFIFIALIGQGHPAPQGKGSIVERRGSVLYITGRIDESVGVKFEQQFTSDVKKLIVNSPGGDAEVSLKMANLISRHRVHLVVNKMCMSGCTYLFLAAHSKVITKGSFFGIHGTYNVDFEEIASFIEKEFHKEGRSAEEIGIMMESIRAANKKVQEEGLRDQFILAKTMGFDARIFEVTAASDFPPQLKEGVSQAFWWPSARLMRKCFNVKNVKDYARPYDEDFDAYLQAVGEPMGIMANKVQIVGDSVNYPCKVAVKPVAAVAP